MASSDLTIEGPFKIAYKRQRTGKGKFIRGEDGRAFWENTELHNLRRKRGCYVFAIRAGKGFTPWYVGKSSRGLKKETFTPDKLNKYNNALFQSGQGRPVLFLVVPKGRKNVVPSKILHDVETSLIQAAFIENEDLINKQKKKLPRWTISGVVRSRRGKPSTEARAFRKMMDL